MDFKTILDGFNREACVMSVDTYEDGTYGNILVVAGNQAYIDDISRFSGHPFVENTPYYTSFPKDLNFEDYIYRSAVLYQPLHTYVNLHQLGLWVEMYLLPLNSDKPGTGYCLYSYVISPKADESNMFDISLFTSKAVLTTCMKLRSSGDFISTIKEVTADIRNLCNSWFCCILTLDHDNETCEVYGDSYSDGIKPLLEGEKVKREFYHLSCSWEGTIGGSTCLIIKNEQDMNVIKERNPLWYESLCKFGVKSMVLFPLRYKGELLGYIWATNFEVENTVKIKEVLELTNFFIASEISNYQMLKKLEVLGTMDILTGTYNRNAMNNRISDFETKGKEDVKSLGIIFADLNGLKRVNDDKGHDEGDKLLKKSSAILKHVFIDDEIYRAGGDEFMILVTNNSNLEFDEKIRKIREMTEEDDSILFAIGTCYEDGDIDIRRALRKADEDMYEDKKEYYSRYPGRRYR